MHIGRYDFKPALWPTLVTLCLLCLLVGLGVWQLGRAEQKRSLQRVHASRIAEPPLALGPSHTDERALRFKPVVVSGVFDDQHQFLLDNRTHRGVAGYHVLTPLRLDVGSVGVLVNRGWVPVGESRARLPNVELSDRRVKLPGIVSVSQGEGLLLGSAGYEASGWPRVVQRIELPAISSAVGYSLLPYVVLMDDQQPSGFVREWSAYRGINPERHQGYAVQWFALAAALVVIYAVVNTRRRPDYGSRLS